MKSNLVSIIIPAYNSAAYIMDTINSVIAQTYLNWELIIVDDCSKDNTIKIIEDFMIIDNRIKLIKQLINKGAANARNIGIKNAKGKYIAFLDSDDRWHVNKLKIQIEAMELKNLSFTFTNYYLTNEKNRVLVPFNSSLNVVHYHDIIKFNYIACSTVVFNQKTLGKHYMPNIQNRQDWGLWIRLIKKSKKAVNINNYLMYYMVRKDSISSNKLKMIKFHWYIFKSFLGFNFCKSLLYLIKNIILHIKNKRK